MSNPLDYLERLREEPEPQRRRFALIVAFCLTGFIFLGWVMSFSAGTSVYTQSSDATSTSPIAALGDALKQSGSFINDVKSLISESSALFGATSTVYTATSTE